MTRICLHFFRDVTREGRKNLITIMKKPNELLHNNHTKY